MKYQGELDRLRKKMETGIAGLEEQLEAEKKARADAERAAHEAEEHASRLEYDIEEAHNLLNETSTTLQVRFIAYWHRIQTNITRALLW